MDIRMRSGLVSAIAWLAMAALGSFCATYAGAAIILVSKGQITTGSDTSGAFGTAGSNLAGQGYKLMIAYDDFSGTFHASSSTFEKQMGPVTGVVSVTVGGVPFSPVVTRSFGAFLYVNNNGVFSELAGFQSGNDAQGQAVYAAHDLSSTAGTVTGPGIGMTAYTAVAGDVGLVNFSTSGAAGSASFTATPTAAWLVFPPPQLIASLVAYVRGLGLSGGIQTSFLAKLTAAQADLVAGDSASATQSITDFINEAKAQSGKVLTSAQASQMIGQAQTILFTIGVIYSA